MYTYFSIYKVLPCPLYGTCRGRPGSNHQRASGLSWAPLVKRRSPLQCHRTLEDGVKEYVEVDSRRKSTGTFILSDLRDTLCHHMLNSIVHFGHWETGMNMTPIH